MNVTSFDPEALVRKNILQLKPYSSARSEFKGQAEVFLDANENPYDTGLNRYPDPLQKELKQVLQASKGIAAQRIFLGNGSDEVIDLLIRIFCEPRQDQILILPPTYGMYRVSADIADVAVREVPLLPGFQPDVAGILAAANDRTKLLFLCSPNNPTGNSLKPTYVRDILDSFPGIVVVDEAYIDFSAQPSYTKWLEDYERLVVMQTFSKAWGLAAIRLGMAFAHPKLIALLNKVKPPYNVNALTQQAALTALQQPAQQTQWVETIVQQRTVLQQRLTELDFVAYIHPSDANFLLVKVTDPVGLYRYLVRHGIIVRDRSQVLLCDDCLRITVGTPRENEQLLQALSVYTP